MPSIVCLRKTLNFFAQVVGFRFLLLALSPRRSLSPPSMPAAPAPRPLATPPPAPPYPDPRLQLLQLVILHAVCFPADVLPRSTECRPGSRLRGLAKRAAKKRRHKQVLLSLSPPAPPKGRPDSHPILRSHVPDLCSSHTQRVSLLHAQALRYAETADNLDCCWKAVAQAAAFAAERTSLYTRTAPRLSAAVPLTPLRCARARRRAQRRQRLRARHTLTSVNVDPHAATQLFLAHGNQRWASTLDAAKLRNLVLWGAGGWEVQLVPIGPRPSPL